MGKQYNNHMKLGLKKIEYKWFTYILGAIFAIIIMDILTRNVQSPIIHKMFHVVTEKNIPSLFSTLQLMLSGTLLYSTYRLCCEKMWMKKHHVYWKYLSFIFYFLAFDEWFTVHDILGKSVAKYMGVVGDLFGWTLLYMIIMIIFFVWALQFLFQLPKRISGLYILSGGIFILGAIGFELLASETIRAFMGIESSPLMVYIIGLTEESLEMLGICLFNWATFIYIQMNDKASLVTLNVKVFVISIVFGVIDIILTYYYQYYLS